MRFDKCNYSVAKRIQTSPSRQIIKCIKFLFVTAGHSPSSCKADVGMQFTSNLINSGQDIWCNLFLSL